MSFRKNDDRDGQFPPTSSTPDTDGQSVCLQTASRLAGQLGQAARNSCRQSSGLPPTGPLVPTRHHVAPQDSDGLHEAMLGYCSAWDQPALERCTRALGVSSEFLLDFPTGWIPELGCMAIGTMDRHGNFVGIEVVPVSIPAGVIVDVSALHGSAGFPALPLNPAPSGPLLVDSDWKQLEAHWRAGGSVAWRGSDAICERAYASIEAYRSRSGLGEPVYGAEERRPAGIKELARGLRASAMSGRGSCSGRGDRIRPSGVSERPSS